MLFHVLKHEFVPSYSAHVTVFFVFLYVLCMNVFLYVLYTVVCSFSFSSHECVPVCSTYMSLFLYWQVPNDREEEANVDSTRSDRGRWR